MDSRKKAVNDVKKYIDAHSGKLIRLSDVARAAGYSKYHLNRIFQEEAGCTIYKYIQALRLEDAASQLRDGDSKMMDITFMTGYESYQAFSRAFKKKYGQTPLQYREVCRKPEVQGQKGKAINRNWVIFALPFRKLQNVYMSVGC